nr:VanZ family protein [uncultured Sellimonas sp.]
MRTHERKWLRRLGKLLFILYILFLFYFLLFSDWYGRSSSGTREYHYNLELFKEIRRFWIYREQLGVRSVANLAGNVLIFVPFGFFMPMASKYWNRSFFLTVFYSFGISFFVEIFQLLTRVGSFDVDDLLLNTMGGLCGYILFAICNGIRRNYVKKQQRQSQRKKTGKR